MAKTFQWSRNLDVFRFDAAARDPSLHIVDTVNFRGLDLDFNIYNHVMAQMFEFIAWAVDGNRVILRTRWARILLEVSPPLLVDITYVPNRVRDDYKSYKEVARYRVSSFKLLKNDLSSLGDKLRASPDRKLSFDRIYNGKEG